MVIHKRFLENLSVDKVNINAGAPIEMSLFLSFLMVKVEKEKGDYLGKCTGWTLYENKERKLILYGGKVGSKEYLDSIQYGNRLKNQYNNYVNPFYLFDIMTLEGKQFFIEYYKEDIQNLLKAEKQKIDDLKEKLESEAALYEQFRSEAAKLEEILRAHKEGLVE